MRRRTARAGPDGRPRRVPAPLMGVVFVVTAGTLVWGCHAVAPLSGSAAPPSPRATPASKPSPSRLANSRLWPSYLPNPQHRMLLGAFTGLAGQTSDEASIEQREAAMGRRYDLELTYYQWNDPFPDFGEATIVAHGRIPVMTWYGPGKDRGDHRTLAEINDGSDDAWIMSQAEAIKQFGKPIFLRPMIEMNGTWYRGYSGQPAAYISAWRRIHNIFARAGASNVIWAWCPNNEPADWDSYYPGDSYVDIIGVDGYNWPSNPWQTFEQLFDPFLEHYAGRKPLMIGEVGTNATRGNEAAFIDEMHGYLKNVAGPRYGVVALCWFDSDISGGGTNWRVDQTPAAWKAWLALARDPYLGGRR